MTPRLLEVAGTLTIDWNAIFEYCWRTEWVHFALYIVAANAIAALDAPTKDSTAFYKWFFKFLNGVGSNLPRAINSSVESSPNFQAAYRLQEEKNRNGGTQP